MTSIRKWLKGIFVLLLTAAAAVYLFWHDNAAQMYITAPVEKGHLTLTIKATGTVEAVTTVDISSQLSGRIADVFVNFNETVKAGQPIARLDPEIYIARVNEARAALNVAKATKELQRVGIQRAKAMLENARSARKMEEARLHATQARQEEAERQFSRYAKLRRVESASDRDMTQARAMRDEGEAGLRAAEEQINMAAGAIEISQAELLMAEANLVNAAAVVEQKRATLDQAELDRDRTEIRAPIDGVVIKRDVNPGQTVAVSLEAKTLFKIAKDLQEMEIRGKIDEADIGRLREGQVTSFTVDAYPARTFNGRVLQIRKSPEIVQNVVTYTAIVSAPNPDLLLFPGMTAVIRIVITDTGKILTIPGHALRFRPGGHSPGEEQVGKTASAPGDSGTVWMLDAGGQPRSVEVSLGISDENTVELVGGNLKEGQSLIVGIATPQSRAGFLGLRLGF